MLNGNRNYSSKYTYIREKSRENTKENIKNATAATVTKSTKTINTTTFFTRLTTI